MPSPADTPPPPGHTPAPSLDDEIKHLQRDKLRLELKHLKGLSLDAVAKLVVAILGIAAAAWAVRIGLIKAQSDLIDARERLATQTEQLAKKSGEVAELDARRARITEVYEQLQTKVRNLEVQQEKVAAAGAKPAAGSTELKARLAEAARPTVFVQFAGELNRDAVINPLRQSIAGGGFNVPAAERIDRGQRNQVRYFVDSAEEKASAEKIASIVTGYFKDKGCPLPSLEVRLAANPSGQWSPQELWLMHSCTTPAG